MFGLSPENWAIVCQEAIKPLQKQGASVWVFGSRARGDHRQFSDLDILYATTQPLALDFIGNIRERLENSKLPILVDIVDIDNLESSYYQKVVSERQLIEKSLFSDLT